MVVGPGEAVKAGGFLTGWKGIAIFTSIIAVVAVMAITGIQAERNTFPRLSTAETEFNVGDYGLGALYAPCITNGSFIGQRWVADLPIPGTNGDTVETVPLGNRRLLSQLSSGGIDDRERFNNNPEFVCFVICRSILKDDCTYFTYDGLDADSCRFGAPDFPMEEIQQTDPEDFRFVYNATCMQERREALVAPIETPSTGLERPNGRQLIGNDVQAERMRESLLKNTQFMRAQWAGPLPKGNEYVTRGGPEWREEGFIVLAGSCEGQPIEGSFATGDHVIVTMATANQVALMSLALTWWKGTIGQLGGQEVRADRDELLRGAAYLIRAWEPEEDDFGRIMLGVGDQLSATGQPRLFEDFGNALNALQIGRPAFTNGQAEPVAPECTYARNDQPDPATAAHAAAALALGSIAVGDLTAGTVVNPADMQQVAKEMYRYSVENHPLTGPVYPPFNASTLYGASQLYPLDEGTPLQVFSHQLWAACALFQATGDEEYWQDTLAIYARYFDAVEPEDGSPLFNPSANYRNPQWYALLCMAQSSPDASKIADDPLIAVPEHVDPSAESEANETAAGWAAGQRADYRRYLRAQLPATGTRMEVMRQLSNNFVNPWLTLQSQAEGEPGDDPVFEQNVRLSASSPDNFHYFDLNGINDDDPIGVATVIRDAANAALVSLVYADLPGVDEEQRFQARCMAKQQVDFVLGENSGQISLQASIGDGDQVTDFWHKDAACPSTDDLDAFFTPVAVRNPDFNATAEEPVPRVTFATRRCDFLSFFGNNTDPEDNPEFVDFLDETGGVLPNPLDPVLPNPNNLTGAVAATFDVSGESGAFVVNQRLICKTGDPDLSTCERPAQKGPNPHTQVSIDTNAAFFGAAAGVAALPASFWSRVAECPPPGDRAESARLVRDLRIEQDQDAIEPARIQAATADPNLAILQESDNGLRVPRRTGAPAPVDDDAPAGGDESAADDYTDEGRR